MLLLLEIQDFGLIARASLEFTSGLNVLTGETGAGKSIIIDALQVVLGHRASAEQIRTGRERARLTAVFDISRLTVLKDKLAAWGIPEEEEGTLVMSRELTRSGRNTCRLNGQAVAAGLYREAGRFLVAFSGQHEQQFLLSSEYQRELLDRYGGQKTESLARKVREIYSRLREAKRNWQEMVSSAHERARRLDMLRFQMEEIDRAELTPEEEEELARERLRLANAEKILFLAGECYSQLRGGQNTPGALDCLGQARRSLGELARLDEALSPLLLAVEGAYYQVDEAARELAGYREKIQVDPGRLQLVEERLVLIRNLKKKYGDTVNDILRYREEAQREYDMLSAAEENAGTLEKEVCRCEEEWQQAAGELSLFRRDAAIQLEKEITEELVSLEMGRVEFRVHFEEQAEISPAGKEVIQFLISPNPGEPLKPLAKIASGGELSRIMLAFGAILAAVDEVPTLVYDEVDTGIGGKTLRAVAEKLSRIAGRRQVICVTHAASVACYADTHYHVHKVTEDRQTTIQVRQLKEEERLSEIARMLAGKEDSLTVEHARQLLRQAGKTG